MIVAAEELLLEVVARPPRQHRRDVQRLAGNLRPHVLRAARLRSDSRSASSRRRGCGDRRSTSRSATDRSSARGGTATPAGPPARRAGSPARTPDRATRSTLNDAVGQIDRLRRRSGRPAAGSRSRARAASTRSDKRARRSSWIRNAAVAGSPCSSTTRTRTGCDGHDVEQDVDVVAKPDVLRSLADVEAERCGPLAGVAAVDLQDRVLDRKT